MSNLPFSFPPPPPPPPRRSEQNDTISMRGRGRGGFEHSRGGGGFLGSRGRGPRASIGRGRSSEHRGQRLPPAGAYTSTAPSPSTAAPQSVKRSHSTAFQRDLAGGGKPKAPPAVPSFTASLANLLPLKPPPPKGDRKEIASNSKPKNALGLTPAAADTSDSEDDDGEEARLVATSTGLDLEFSYRGQTAALRTPAEIAAWIAERKRRYPTQAKREAAQKAADARKKKWDAEKQARAEALRATRQFRQQTDPNRLQQKQTQKKPPSDSPSLAAVKLRAEKLRRKALKAQRDLEAAEAVLRDGTIVAAKESTAAIRDLSSDDDSLGPVSDSSELTGDDESSGSESGTDDDTPPEQQSSKVEVKHAFVEQVPSPRQVKRPCKAFLKTGRCRFGSNCLYSHQPSSRSATGKGVQVQRKLSRKGLFQVMIEKEQEEERRKAVSAIISLGQQGLLEEPS